MKKKVKQFYRMIDGMEFCFNVEHTETLTDAELGQLKLLFADGFIAETVTEKPGIADEVVAEVGPRLNFETAWSSNMVSICHATGLDKVTRVERSRRYFVDNDVNRQEFIDSHHDRMTECHYLESLSTFDTGIEPESVYDVELIDGGADLLESIPGISMDSRDRNFYYDYFVGKHERNPTIVEIMDLNNANCEHSRHGYFRGKHVINDEEMDETLLEIVQSTLAGKEENSIIAYTDNSSGIYGRPINTIIPENPGYPSKFESSYPTYHILFTAETHNFPTGVAPKPGAETGTGGRIRDIQGTGKGGFVVAGTAGYCVANLHISGYDLPWEERLEYPSNLASALQIEIEASNGASDYGNKFGEPVIQGFTHSFDMRFPNNERWGFLKPIMFTGGIGQIDDRHIEKEEQEKGMLIVQVGGPAYRVGFGGGAASSMLQGDNVEDLDFNAVQRGNAEMEQKMNRVIRACNEMGDKTLIDVIHDQGAGGPGNVLKELVEKSGGWIEIRRINVGDPTMSVLEIYVAEYQERNGFLICPENIERFQAICNREKVNCEVLGEVTGDMRFVVRDEQDGSTPVDVELDVVLGDIPQKTFEAVHVDPHLKPLVLPEELTVKDALRDVLRLMSVGSKRFLTNKVDRAVTGLVAQQQCCGPLQLSVADVAVIAQSHFVKSGAATAIGEQPNKMLVDPKAGARMAVGEALTNLVWAKIDDLDSVKCSANWMWAPKLPGEGAALYDAVDEMRGCMKKLGVAVDGGKDSLSMATRVGKETVKSPRQLVLSTYATMLDINKVVTPDIKRPGESRILFIDLSNGKNRLGGSALAQVHKQIGNESPDMDDPDLIKRAFQATQELIGRDIILAGHDRSDGGFITTVLEMAFAGNCGFAIDVAKTDDVLATLFSEELGLIIEVASEQVKLVQETFDNHRVPCIEIGHTKKEKLITIFSDSGFVLWKDMRVLRSWWEESSYQLEKQQMNPDCANEEKENIYDRKGPSYNLSFTPQKTSSEILLMNDKPKVAILRDEGSNSDREMASAFYQAGFEPWDVTMTDLLEDRINLEQFRGLAAVGGFSYADVPESAKGWAATIMFNEKLKAMFNEFYTRPDTFSLGVCNGCQLFALIGWVPWQGIAPEDQPRFVKNKSGRFESRWSTVKVLESSSIMLSGMEDMIFGIHVDHSEGQLVFPNKDVFKEAATNLQLPVAYVNDNNKITEDYPFNPNGSANGLTAICTEDGRHLAMMPHPERCFLPWQCHWLPEEMKEELRQIGVSPWMKMFQNAYDWCIKAE
ncbi:phosphoribosylformylglycinamidine synthase [Candidatus Falkowbacteria bacterium]|nr:phosphoribosylformylglycinamidine synthase [Candidatus Falkowbacteria bacterium]